ncbi:uncharacterized protein LOC142802833 [Rhipicephalus microplus]|uniref:uncharacterized protein LOC142802833 n=1 Tax=Rhipicephalus microplus TaxID=6941 RepID=UPI003F6B29B0
MDQVQSPASTSASTPRGHVAQVHKSPRTSGHKTSSHGEDHHHEGHGGKRWASGKSASERAHHKGKSKPVDNLQRESNRHAKDKRKKSLVTAADTKVKHSKVADADKSKASKLKNAHDSSKPPNAAASFDPQGAKNLPLNAAAEATDVRQGAGNLPPNVVAEACLDQQGAENLPPNVVAVEDPELPKQGKHITRRKRLYLLVPGARNAEPAVGSNEAVLKTTKVWHGDDFAVNLVLYTGATGRAVNVGEMLVENFRHRRFVSLVFMLPDFYYSHATEPSINYATLGVLLAETVAEHAMPVPRPTFYKECFASYAKVRF